MTSEVLLQLGTEPHGRVPSGPCHRAGSLGLQGQNLQGSQVELLFSNSENGSNVPASVSVHNGDMGEMLLDAQLFWME